MKGVICKNMTHKKEFEAILFDWNKYIEEYTNDIDNSDALYWYNERATLSTFSSALTLNKYYSLDEFCVSKNLNKAEYPGRADLWFLINRTNYILEAKQKWPKISSKSHDKTKYINNKLDEIIENDIARARQIGDKHVALLFVAPTINSNTTKEETSETIIKFIESAKKSNYNILSYVFPEKAKIVGKQTNYSYPGVVLIGRIISE